MTAVAETALGIARGLASEAIWHEGRCNWIGPRPAGGDRPAAVGALSPELYGGTAGVGLVLAETGALTGDADCRRAARGALRQSLSAADRLDRRRALGLYGGAAGIALAAVRSGLVLGDSDLVEGRKALAARLPGLAGGTTSADLVDGRAGAVAGLLAVGAALAEAEPVAAAAALAHELVTAAEQRGSWAWAGDARGSGLLTTGFAHGASGAAWVLIELWGATGEARLRAAAGDAWRAERARFDPLAGNWPAAREGAGAAADAPWVSEVAWCHGAPGIALARHRASTLAGDEAGATDAAVALATTAAWTRAALRSLRGSYCLCHGLAGNAEVLADCADAAGDGAALLRELADEVAQAGIEEYARPSRPWPCGWPGGESPGLMTGLAGIARFYLRRHEPGLPSMLLPRPAGSWSGALA